MTNEEINAVLPVSIKQLAHLMGCCREIARRRVIAMQLVPVQWVRTGGSYEPLYGNGPAAPRPPRLTGAERIRNMRERRKNAPT